MSQRAWTAAARKFRRERVNDRTRDLRMRFLEIAIRYDENLLEAFREGFLCRIRRIEYHAR